MKRSTSSLQRGAEDAVVERVVDLGQRVRELVEVRDPADDRGEVDHVRAAGDRRARLVELAQVAGVHLAALAHPGRRRALVGDAHLPVGIAQQPAHDGGADRAGASGDEDAVHRRSRLAGAQRGDLARVGEHLRGAERVPGSTTRQSAAAVRGDRRERLRRRVGGVVRGDDDDVGARDRLVEARRRRRHDRVVHGDVGELALEQPDQLVRERVALVVGVALEREPEHGDLALAQVAEPALDALDEEQRHALVDARDREQHARARSSAPR